MYARMYVRVSQRHADKKTDKQADGLSESAPVVGLSSVAARNSEVEEADSPWFYQIPAP